MSRIGIIGGSGLYELDGIRNLKEMDVDTPFGKPSDALMLGELQGKEIAFLSRHGRGHIHMPTEINYLANIYAMKKLGVRFILSASATGSLKEEHKPTDILLPDQFIDRTKHRKSTFFGEGIVAHVAFAQPICMELSDIVYNTSKKIGIAVKQGGTYVCMEGPMFSTRAESFLYRSWGADLIGMTNLQEAKLAREAEIAYVTIAIATDYDCWHESEEHVSVELIMNNFKQTIEKVKALIKASIEEIDEEADFPCHHALAGGIMTNPDSIPAQTYRKLEPIIGKYIIKQGV